MSMNTFEGKLLSECSVDELAAAERVIEQRRARLRARAKAIPFTQPYDQMLSDVHAEQSFRLIEARRTFCIPGWDL